jgi:hypothetical protein
MEKTQDKKELLGTAPIRGLLFRLALPTVAAQLINMLYNIVDRIYIGHIAEVGDLALTGVGVCMPLIMLVSAFAALVGSGGAPRSSIFMGKGDMKSAERTLGGCFGLQILVSLVLTVVLCTWNRDLLLAFGASENTIAYAAEYMGLNQGEGFVWGTIRTALASVADLCVIPMQDYLELGGEARMNFPGTLGNNWVWRAEAGCFTTALADKICKLTRLYGRFGKTSV